MKAHYSKPLTNNDLQSIATKLNSHPEHLQLMAMFHLVCSGLRANEIASLDWSDIHSGEKRIISRARKRRIMTRHLSNDASRALQKLRRTNIADAGPVFCNADGSQASTEELTRMFNEAVKFSPHQIRITKLAQSVKKHTDFLKKQNSDLITECYLRFNSKK